MHPPVFRLRADDKWYIQSVVAHFGESMRGGHYVSACTAPSGDFMRPDDAVLYGPMALAGDWVFLNSAPLLLIYANDRPHGP